MLRVSREALGVTSVGEGKKSLFSFYDIEDRK